jgi:zinc-ribbon domain
MAFCNSCGASLTPGTRFCSKCGAAVIAPSATAPGTSNLPAGSAPAPAGTTITTSAQGGNALKVIVIVVGVLILVGILGVASVGFFAWHIARRTHVRQNGDNVRVETPFGSVESTNDPRQAARNLGVDLYPGARVVKNGSAAANVAGIRTVSVTMESDDSADKVAEFYRSKFPNAMVNSSESGQSTIVANRNNSLITINIESEGNKTKILITNVAGRSGNSAPASD